MYTRSEDGAGGVEKMSNRSVDDESRFTEICTILSVCCALSTIAVTLRSYTRLVLLHTFGWDDGVMVAAQILAIAAAVTIGLESKFGLGSHTWVQPEAHLFPYMKAFYSSIIMYNMSMCFVKISILLQYRRIFSLQMMQRITFYAVAFIVAWSITIFFLMTLVCVPVAKFWDHTLPGRCLDSLTLWYVMAAFNLVSDFAIFGLPLPVVRSLQLPKKQKVMLFAVFGLGFFTCIISIIRIRTLKIAASTDDPNWDNVDAATWSYLEVTTAILAACLPTLRPVFAKIMPSLMGSSIRGNQGRSQGGAYIHAPDGSTNTIPNKTRVTSVTVPVSDSTWSLQDQDRIELVTQDAGRVSVAGNYKVTVSGGVKSHQNSSYWSALNRSSKEDEKSTAGKGGIQATTLVTQQVTIKSRQEQEPEERSPTSDEGSNGHRSRQS
ncbi:hypothetical protein VD0002_g5242 [Verticillium dahliae]|nr:hypothetical protein VdG2_00859 [Verticillium dahliae VDG2]KAH6707374.1 hypothetical protein EV126DRAFT_411545 [Verticillium dahliae]PNH56427.1 hypothetical protein VD0003_g1268 [Verticillium dahliae]PNH62944.1 hypothetical protein VD0002_g5242 [Verticillium dahliae]RXG43835.1 hypothetical protein VDGE_02899 [Verticillium dahliae]